MKAVLISIQPKWCELIASGKKTVEVRKNRPTIKPPFKCYIYCTKKGRPLVHAAPTPCDEENLVQTYGYSRERADKIFGIWNGRVIGEFVCDEIFPISIEYSDTNSNIALNEFSYTCLSDKEIMDYLGNGQTGYGWHISELQIYEKPLGLHEFCPPCDPVPGCFLQLLQTSAYSDYGYTTPSAKLVLRRKSLVEIWRVNK